MRVYAEFIAAFLIIVLFWAVVVLKGQGVEASLPRFSRYYHGGSITTVKHHPTQKCWISLNGFAPVETTTEVCN
jgi:hypothetical protein